jgi:hypothetical protein
MNSNDLLRDIEIIRDKYQGVDYSAVRLSDEDITKIKNYDKKLMNINEEITYKNKNILDGLTEFVYYKDIPNYNKDKYFEIVSNKLKKYKEQQSYNNLKLEDKLKIQKEKEIKELEWAKIIKERQEEDKKEEDKAFREKQSILDKARIANLNRERKISMKAMIFYIIVLIVCVIVSIVFAIKVNPLLSLLLLLAIPIGYVIYINKTEINKYDEELNSYK